MMIAQNILKRNAMAVLHLLEVWSVIRRRTKKNAVKWRLNWHSNMVTFKRISKRIRKTSKNLKLQEKMNHLITR